jgi:hypothetical protein
MTEDTYMKFGWDAMSSQLGVTANELVEALQKHTKTIEYDLEVPSTPGMSRAHSSMSRAQSGLSGMMSRARSGLSHLTAPFTSATSGTLPAAQSEQSEQPHQASGFIILVPSTQHAEDEAVAAPGDQHNASLIFWDTSSLCLIVISPSAPTGWLFRLATSGHSLFVRQSVCYCT